MPNRIKKEQRATGFSPNFYVNFRFNPCLYMERMSCKRLRNRFREFMAVNAVDAFN